MINDFDFFFASFPAKLPIPILPYLCINISNLLEQPLCICPRYWKRWYTWYILGFFSLCLVVGRLARCCWISGIRREIHCRATLDGCWITCRPIGIRNIIVLDSNEAIVSRIGIDKDGGCAELLSALNLMTTMFSVSKVNKREY